MAGLDPATHLSIWRGVSHWRAPDTLSLSAAPLGGRLKAGHGERGAGIIKAAAIISPRPLS